MSANAISKFRRHNQFPFARLHSYGHAIRQRIRRIGDHGIGRTAGHHDFDRVAEIVPKRHLFEARLDSDWFTTPTCGPSAWKRIALAGSARATNFERKLKLQIGVSSRQQFT